MHRTFIGDLDHPGELGCIKAPEDLDLSGEHIERATASLLL